MASSETTQKSVCGLVGNDTWKSKIVIEQLFPLALDFYRSKSTKASLISYEDNLKLVALVKQVIHGPFSKSNQTELGAFDFIGKDRRAAWQQLGDMSKKQSMEAFVVLLQSLCPTFSLFVEAMQRNKENQSHKDELCHEILPKTLETPVEEEPEPTSQIKRRQLQDALNQQTYRHFKVYAEEQFPQNPEEQAKLIRQLQNEHYHQYMQKIRAEASALDVSAVDINTNIQQSMTEHYPEKTEHYAEEADNCNEMEIVAPAKMWTRTNIEEFKAEVLAGNGDGVINLDHGEIVTVRIPTNDAGKSLFWEFSSDSYDVGFGVYFEWCKPTTKEVTIHISESEDDDLYDGEEDEEESEANYFKEEPLVFPGSTAQAAGSSFRNPISVIVPLYRRDCHKEVYAGSHSYPGEGVYLLKFDNSYSIWRSKTLYYKIYYECSF